MTSTEFNEKYKDYLQEGFYGLNFNNPDVTKFLDNIFQDLITIPGFKYSQIKMKFGSARFYSTLKSGLQYLIEGEIDKIFKQ